MGRLRMALLGGALLVLGLFAWPGAAHAGVIERVSLSNTGLEATGTSDDPSVSADGRHVAFESSSNNLVSDDTNGTYDVFVRDRQTGATTRVSVGDNGAQGNGWSSDPSISADGRFIAYQSEAANLVGDDTNGVWDVFVYDRIAEETTRVSVYGIGEEGNGASYAPTISADGTCVAFTSEATDLVSGDTNGCADVFVRDLQTLSTERVSLTDGTSQADAASGSPSISGDGNLVAFASTATNLLGAGADTNGYTDIFVRDLQSLSTERVNVNGAGGQSGDAGLDPAISADGRYVAFRSSANDLVSGDTNGYTDVYVHDRTTGAIERVSVATSGAESNNGCYYPALSADGACVVFESSAGTLSVGDTNDTDDIFVHTRASGTTVRLSVDGSGAEGNGSSRSASISADGTDVAFGSVASNLVADDTNHNKDIFVAEVSPAPTITGLSPTVGPTAGGTSIVITGAGFTGLGPAASDPDAVTFGGVNATTYTVDSSTQITATAPPHSKGTVQVKVTTAGGFSVDTAADDYTYQVIYTSIIGTDRFDTAIKISQAMCPGALPDGSGVVLAPGWESYQEALCGAPLAAAWGGPVLLSSKTVLYSGVAAELIRLSPDQVFLIGLSPAVATAVQTALPGVAVTSINGAGTTANIVCDMSRKVANALKQKVENLGGDVSEATAIVTIGSNFPDAIGVSPLACANLWPVVLTDKAGGVPAPALHPSATATFTDLGMTEAIKVGTYAVLPAGVSGLAQLSGADRYFTNANVATWGKTYAGLAFAHTGLTTGDKFPDALASGPYLAKDDGILLLSPLTGPLPAPISAVITTNRDAVAHFTFIACVEPVIGAVKGLLP